jgi:methylphosphotriester-DNA--protein-cysteine methyltransferase
MIRSSKIKYAGNMPAKIYGTLSCHSGKRMKKKNRMFFASEAEAINAGFRPCGSCMRGDYEKWKMLRSIKQAI